MTKKLYYLDAYIKEFDADVLSVSACDGKFSVVLSETAFFPEEGGQSADTGFIGDARVLDVREENSVIYHITDKAPNDNPAHCTIDFEERFVKMQCHTAEHILCGFIHKLYGLSNVGFHLGDDEVTFDVDGVLDREQLDTIEMLANEAVFANVKIDTFFPTPDEISHMEYRSKLDLTEGVRIVKIGDYDSCACCAPHVSYTGEIGLIKVLDFMKHRGGTRIWMVAGKRALVDYRTKYENIKKISALTSAPQHETAEVLGRYMGESERIKQELKICRLNLAEKEGSLIPTTSGNLVVNFPEFSIPELIAFSNVAAPKVSGILVALSGVDGDYKYVISSSSVNLREEVSKINSELSGRGGGKPNMIQGSFLVSLSKIKDYFMK
ncbi:MAG: hypothetical protein E7676_06220 [Ruminococcaceae bacterium]|nr:hypothetical protein [Oscillospiraceae bacterium]